MTEHIFSAEYAASLVQRARDGATFVFVPWGDGGAWRRQSDCPNWVTWFRETAASISLTENTDTVGGEWSKAWRQLRDLRDEFDDAIDALGSLCQLPSEWADEHREEARRIGGGDG